MKKWWNSKNRGRTISYLLVIAGYLFCEISMRSGSMSSLIKSSLVPLTCYIVAALALNLLVGFSGELSLGQAGFMSIGAFSGIIVSESLLNSSLITSPVLRLILALLTGAFVAAVFGFLIAIPVLKLQGDYLAIVTLAFGQIIKTLLNNVYLGVDEGGLHFSFISNNVVLSGSGKMLLNGPMGATGTDRIAAFTAGFLLILFALTLIYNLIFSRYGRAIMAARDNRIAALSSGIDVTKIKTLVFVLSSSLAGAAGALYGLNYATVTAAKFDFNTSIMILVYVVLGGLGNISGTIISTVILVLLPDLMRPIRDYRMLIYAVVLILMMIISNSRRVKTLLGVLKEKLKRKGGDSHE